MRRMQWRPRQVARSPVDAWRRAYNADMFIGHFAVGFAAKRAAPSVPLVALFARRAAGRSAVAVPSDGRHRAGAHSRRATRRSRHSTSSAIRTRTRSCCSSSGAWRSATSTWRRRSASSSAFAVLAALVVSHWVLDVVTHRPDMPVYPGGPKVGLGLWNSVAATIAIEVLMFVIGFVDLHAGHASARSGRTMGGSGARGLSCARYLANIGSPPPPTVNAIAIGAAVGAAVIMLVTLVGRSSPRTGRAEVSLNPPIGNQPHQRDARHRAHRQ